MMKAQRRDLRIVRNVGLFALGATMGSIAALLFAPAAGRVTRKRIALKLRTLKRQTTRRLGEQIKQAQTWVVEHVHNGNGRRIHHPTVRHA